jgi:hypothetical protein
MLEPFSGRSSEYSEAVEREPECTEKKNQHYGDEGRADLVGKRRVLGGNVRRTKAS